MSGETPPIRVDNLCVRVGGATLLQDVSVEIPPGGFLAVLGPNGAGKTTLLRALAGLVVPSAGEIFLGDAPLASLSVLQRSRLLGLVGHEAPPPFPWSVLELVLMGRAPHLGLRALETDADLEHARAALRRVGMESFSHRSIETLSAGERQRVMWARALCQNPGTLLLDEPTSHQDPGQALALMTLLRDQARSGQTVIAVLHDVNLAARFADQVLVLCEGTVAGAGPMSSTLTTDLLATVYQAPCRRVEDTLVFDPSP
jgi:iron complex transport system ATP-binding protein